MLDRPRVLLSQRMDSSPPSLGLLHVALVEAIASGVLKDCSSFRSCKVDNIQEAGAFLCVLIESMDLNLENVVASA